MKCDKCKQDLIEGFRRCEECEAKYGPTLHGVNVLRRILRRMRWNDQGGYPCYLGEGKWAFESTGLPQTTPEELNALFELAGLVPDVIVPIGDCSNCRFSIDGSERGYAEPCGSCKRPKMSNWKPSKILRKSAKKIEAAVAPSHCMNGLQCVPGSCICLCGACWCVKEKAKVMPDEER